MNRDFKPSEFLKSYKGKSDDLSMLKADDTLGRAMLVVNQAETNFSKDLSARNEVLQVVYRNFVVNAVTALEVFLKDIIQEVDWTEDGYRTLLSKAKVNLAEAYDLFGKTHVTRNSIISSYYTFQNMSSVYEVFDALTGKSFHNAMHETKIFEGDFPTFIEHMKHSHKLDFDEEIRKLFSTRHLIVHENADVRLSLAELNKFVALIQVFIFFMVGYFLGYLWLPEDQRPRDMRLIK
jgi:hypothetical protein